MTPSLMNIFFRLRTIVPILKPSKRKHGCKTKFCGRYNNGRGEVQKETSDRTFKVVAEGIAKQVARPGGGRGESRDPVIVT